MPKAYSYIRMSTPEQLKGDSTRRQLKASEDYATTHGLQLTDILHDRGISAYTGENAEMGKLAEFLDLAKSGQIEVGSYLIVESLDRISRANVMKAMAILNDIVECGVIIVTLIDGQVYSREIIANNPTAMMMAALILMRAHEESRTKSVRLASVWANKRSTARNGQHTKQRIPSWLRFSEDGRSIELIEERADLIREIFDLSAGGWGAVSIAKLLNDECISTWAGGRHWHESYIKKILSNRAVLGEYQPHRMDRSNSGKRRIPEGEPIVGYYPSVIDEVLFADVQKAIATRKISGKGRKGAGFSNLFTGLLRCKACKSGMRFIDKGPPPKGGKYLRCSRALLTRECSSPPFRYGIIEEHLFKLLTTINLDAILNNAAWIARTNELKRELLKLDDCENKLLKQINNIADAIAVKGLSEALSGKLNSLELELQSVRSRRGAVDEELTRLSLSSGLDYKALIDKLHSSDIPDEERSSIRRKFSAELGKLVTRIEVGRTYPTLGDDIDDRLFEDLSLIDLDDANRFVDILILYRTGSFTEFDAFTGERTHYEIDPKMVTMRERRKIEKLA